jgi:hypothetical protein
MKSIVFLFLSRGSSVGIVTIYKLDGRGFIPGRGKNFLCNVQTGSGTQPESYPIDTEAHLRGVKVAGA